MKIAYTGWTWLTHHKDNYRYEFEQFLKEIADLGYPSAENFAFITDYFDDDADAVNELLSRYGVTMENLYLHYSTDPEADYAKAVKFVDFMKRIGATYMNLQGVMWNEAPLVRPTDEATIRQYAELSNRIGRLCTENGIRACFHPHAQTPVFAEEQIDLFLSLTDPELVWLCLDTAHTTIAGMDAPAATAKYASRIGYMHLKDVDPEQARSERPMASFRPLGMGVVDFKGVYNALREGGYDGVLCVELDNPPVCNYHAAMVSRQYLHNVLGL